MHRARIAAAPDQRDAAADPGLREERVSNQIRQAVVLADRERGEDRIAGSRGDEVTNRLQAAGMAQHARGGAAQAQGLIVQAMALVEQQQIVAAQTLDGERVRVRQRMVRRMGDDERLEEQMLHGQPILRHRQREKGGIDVAAGEAFEDVIGEALADDQFKTRETRAQRLQHVRDEIGPERRDRPEMQFAGQFAGLGMGQFEQAARLGDGTARLQNDGLGRRGDEDAAARALEQYDAKGIFELGDLCAEGRLRHRAALGGAAEMAKIGHRDHVFEVSQGQTVEHR